MHRVTMEEPDVSDWIGDSTAYFPTFLYDLYDNEGFSDESLWVQSQNLEHELMCDSFLADSADVSTTTEATLNPTPAVSSVSGQLVSIELTKKRRLSEDVNSKAQQKNTNRRVGSNQLQDSRCGGVEQVAAVVAVAPRKANVKRKGSGKAAGSNGNGGSKDGRWAEQLLNPCATAVTARNPSRVQHFLYVLRDLCSLSGDANHRLAYYGFYALKDYVSCAPDGGFAASAGANTFASSNPKFFRDSLMKFHDINPWFRIPYNVANTSILQILAEQDRSSNLHVLDFGVSHGLQWPTLLEELTRRTGGPPPLVRLTVIAPPAIAINGRSRNATPFANGPPNYDFSSKLLTFAKNLNVNLQINKLDNVQIKNLNSHLINSSSDETLIVCAQFMLHNLSHTSPDERSEFLTVLRNLHPKGLILSENNTDCCCNKCGDFATGFSRRVEYLWRFLDSISAAYKGRESDERRMMEAEAAKVLMNACEMNERKEKWGERMRYAGFVGDVFGEETIDGAKALLRKYDSNWEIKVEEKDGCVELLWKGQQISFCSLWKMDGMNLSSKMSS